MSLPSFFIPGNDSLRFPLARDFVTAPIALGCMHFGGDGRDVPVPAEVRQQARTAMETARELGWNLFDHADIYCRGKSESLFGDLTTELQWDRASYFIQTKCGIRFPGFPDNNDPLRFDFSRQHILDSVHQSLQRLRTDYIDVLLLHRPDLLADPQEVMEAFDHLRSSGKVRFFGVSNFPPHLLDLFRAAGFTPVANQVEINLLRTSLLDASVVAQDRSPAPGHPADGTLEWHRIHGVVTQAWAPLAYGYPAGRTPEWDRQRVSKTAGVVQTIATELNAPPEAVVLAFLLRHPAAIQPIVGSRNPQRLHAANQARHIALSREQWYRLYTAGRGQPLP